MRMTNNLMSGTYITNLNKSLSDLNTLNVKVAGGVSYLKASEDPATSLKAMQVRRNLARIGDYSTNISDVKSSLTEIESVISDINETLGNAVTQIMQGETGTYSAEDRGKIALALRSYQKEVLTSANAKYSGEYLFGGNNVDEAPFTVDDSGNLLYNGVDVETGTFDEETRYLDVGMGMSTDGSGNVIDGSAFNIANSGVGVLGSGADGDGITNNIYNLLGDIAEMFETNDLTNLNAYSDKLDSKVEDIMVQYVNVGQKGEFLTFLSTRFDTSSDNALKKQKELEGLDTAKGAIMFKEQKTAYDAALQMGLSILQPSLLDYLN